MKQGNIAGIILCLMGAILCVFSKFIWKISEKWKSNNASGPSVKYTIITRILGGAFIGVGIFLAVGVIS